MHARVIRSRHAPEPAEALKSVHLRGRPDEERLRVDVFAEHAHARAGAVADDEVWEVLDLAGRLDGGTALIHELESEAIASVLETALDRARAEEGNTGAIALIDREGCRGLLLTFWERGVAQRDANALRYEVVHTTDR